MRGKIKNNPVVISFLLFFIILIIISSFPAKICGDVNQTPLLEKLIAADSGFRKPMDNYKDPPEFSFNELYTFGSLKGTLHPAIDYVPANVNTSLQVYAVADGILYRHKLDGGTELNSNEGYGNYVVIAHKLPDSGEIIFSLYAHLNSFDGCPNDGDEVKKGRQIGICGQTGGSNGTVHLHFEIRKEHMVFTWKSQTISGANSEALYNNFYHPDYIFAKYPENNRNLANESKNSEEQGTNNDQDNQSSQQNQQTQEKSIWEKIVDWFRKYLNPDNDLKNIEPENGNEVIYATPQEPQDTYSDEVIIETVEPEGDEVVKQDEESNNQTQDPNEARKEEDVIALPAPAKPFISSPYDWYQSLKSSPTLVWNGDENSNSYYVVANSSNTGNIESGWISDTVWIPNLPNENYVYTWKVKAKNKDGLESSWSDERHFSIASTYLKFEGEVLFTPPSPSSSDEIIIIASTTGWGGVGVTLRVSVNKANDGSSNGEWKILKELGVPKFNINDAPRWDTKGWPNGTYRVRVEAKGPNDPHWEHPAIIETFYTLINK